MRPSIGLILNEKSIQRIDRIHNSICNNDDLRSFYNKPNDEAHSLPNLTNDIERQSSSYGVHVGLSSLQTAESHSENEKGSYIRNPNSCWPKRFLPRGYSHIMFTRQNMYV